MEQPLDEILDRLVDGELNDDEYRELLSSLDSQSDGWRRCAMAFLESQALGNELRALRVEPSESVKAAPSRRSWTWTYGSLLTLASAASFVLAFLVAAQIFQPALQFNRNPIHRNPSIPDGGNTSSAPTSPALNLASSDAATNPLWGEYRVMVDGQDGQPRQIEMPIYSADDPRAAQLLTDDRSTMPVDLIRALQRMGYQVDRQREWTPVQHESGDVLVPIEQLQITPVSSRSYQ